MHQPVLLQEVVDLLQILPGGTYVDGTLGNGGHAEAILKRMHGQGRFIGLDVDPSSLSVAENRLQPFGDLAQTRRANFRGLQEVLRDLKIDEVDGMLFDLGISSPQLDDPERGLSFRANAALDMRLNPDSRETALSFLQKIREDQFLQLLQEFGEERHAHRLSRAILAAVSQGKMKTTGDLAALCEQIVGRHGKVHPATRVFLAIRAAVNDELGAVRDLLEKAPDHLKKGGRIAVITFHSTEDRIVKNKFRELSNQGESPRSFSLVNKKPIEPSEEEQSSNPRSRSAKLRVLERVG